MTRHSPELVRGPGIECLEISNDKSPVSTSSLPGQKTGYPDIGVPEGVVGAIRSARFR